MTTSAQSCTPFSTRRKYGAIYTDPPWSFRNWSAKGTGRNAISHYDCLDFKSLAALPVADLAADDCALFLWATDPLLPRAIELIQAWGFEYKTVAFYWVKLNSAAKHDADFFTGLGYWTRANPEQCLLATRGKPPRQAKNVKRLVIEKRREHSRKPLLVAFAPVALGSVYGSGAGGADRGRRAHAASRRTQRQRPGNRHPQRE